MKLCGKGLHDLEDPAVGIISGGRLRCAPCRKVYDEGWREAHREQQQAYGRAWREAHPEPRRARLVRPGQGIGNEEHQRRYQQKLKLDTFQAYHRGSGPPACIRCGRTDRLCLDHVNDDGPEHLKALGLCTGGSAFYAALRRLDWPNDPPLQILCGSCNTKKAAQVRTAAGLGWGRPPVPIRPKLAAPPAPSAPVTPILRLIRGKLTTRTARKPYCLRGHPRTPENLTANGTCRLCAPFYKYPLYKSPPITAERLWSQVDRSGGPDACWLWQGHCDRGGYGRLAGARAHREAWVQTFGPIPDGLWVLHRCDNPPCCNPRHLFLGTPKDNTRDMMEKGRHAGAAITSCPAGHLYDEANTKWVVSAEGWKSRVCRACNTARALAIYYQRKEALTATQ